MSQHPEHPRELVRFADFELDPVSGELYRGSSVHHLQPQPLKLLLSLLEYPGELVTREQLKQDLMPDAAYGDFDHAINLAASKLRAALEDSPEHRYYIETIPRRGYRFVGSVQPQQFGVTQSAEQLEPERTGRARSQRRRGSRRALFLTLAGLIAGGLVLIWMYYRAHWPGRITEKDTVVLADFTNNTGDPVFTDTLRQGLQAQLSQSPFLNFLSDRKIRDTLKQMGHKGDEVLSDEMAREVCERNGSKVYVGGSITSLGTQYVLGLKAVNCLTGEVVIQQQTQVPRKENVLDSLNKQGTELRRQLGESLSSIQKFDVPLEQASTSSLEALQAFSLGEKQRDRQNFSGGIPFLKRAVELDPNFAKAYAILGTCYKYSGQTELAMQSYTKAYELRQRVGDRERFLIEGLYYSNVSGELYKTIQVGELWKSTYPQDVSPNILLSVAYMFLGWYDKSYLESRDAYRKSPTALTGNNLLGSTIRADRLQEASELLADPKLRQLGILALPSYSYGLAFLRNDTEAMERAIKMAKPGTSGESEILYSQSLTAAYHGCVGDAQNKLREAVEVERHINAAAAAEYLVDAALWEANFGNAAEARSLAAESLQLDPNVGSKVALDYAQAGDLSQARILTDERVKKDPTNTRLHFRMVPLIRAVMEMSQNRPTQAIELLKDVVPIELGEPQVIYTRGQAYLMLHQGHEAIAELQKIVDHPGAVGNDPLGALAHLGIARGYALQGDTARSRAEYEHFLNLWKDADPNIPIYKQALTEYAELR